MDTKRRGVEIRSGMERHGLSYLFPEITREPSVIVSNQVPAPAGVCGGEGRELEPTKEAPHMRRVGSEHSHRTTHPEESRLSGKPLSVLRAPSSWPTPAEVAIVVVLWLACIACAVAAARIDMSPPVATRVERAR